MKEQDADATHRMKGQNVDVTSMQEAYLGSPTQIEHDLQQGTTFRMRSDDGANVFGEYLKYQYQIKSGNKRLGSQRVIPAHLLFVESVTSNIRIRGSEVDRKTAKLYVF
eukprot:8365989-Pyramimonas_sp.AAC.1